MDTRHLSRALVAGFLCVGAFARPAFADNSAHELLKAMSDFMGKQQAFSFDYDSTIEAVTPQLEKLQFASSGNVTISRPNKLKVNRTGGFADVEAVFDGNTFSILGRNLNAYAEIEAKGSLGELADKLANAGIQPPGADLLSPDIYDLLMDDQTTGNHISSAYVNGVKCEYLAFRSPDVDWQIWIREGDQPVPLRYVITSKDETGAPQYTIQTRNWKFGADAGSDFKLDKPADAKKVDLSQMPQIDEIPNPANLGEDQ